MTTVRSGRLGLADPAADHTAHPTVGNENGQVLSERIPRTDYAHSFPAFACGPLTFFANTGLDLFHELGVRLFHDPRLSPVLLEAGYGQIGNPFFPNYDPVCLAPGAGQQEGAVVRLDHELILQNGVIQTVSMLAKSFADLLNQLVHGDAMADEVG